METLISKAVSPDSAEIYSSPVILDRLGGQTPSIIFGTGGEQHSVNVCLQLFRFDQWRYNKFNLTYQSSF